MNATSTKLDATKTAAIVVAVVAVISLIGGSLYWMGHVSNRVDTLDTQVRELRIEVRDLRAEMQDMRHELLVEIRRSNEQMLEARYNHTHDEGGDAVFRRPLIENPLAAAPTAVLQETSRRAGARAK